MARMAAAVAGGVDDDVGDNVGWLILLGGSTLGRGEVMAE